MVAALKDFRRTLVYRPMMRGIILGTLIGAPFWVAFVLILIAI